MIGRFDHRLIGQAVDNVVKNATEAVEAAMSADEREGRIDVKVHREGPRFVIDVIDNGIGWPKENRQRLLEPYMTTREKGTGLGLAIVGKIVEEHGGRIELRDAPAVAEGGSGGANGPSHTVGQWRRRNRRSRVRCRRKPDRGSITKMASDILIVDDETDIRDLVAGILEDEGHATRTAADADTAPLPRSATAGPRWPSSTSGCRAAASTASACSTRSRPSIPNCRW